MVLTLAPCSTGCWRWPWKNGEGVERRFGERGERMRIGIIGAGRHGTRYANHILNDLPELELAAISRRSAEGCAQAERWGCRCFTDWRALVREREVEAVIGVATPNLHGEIAAACVEAGKPLLLEKPLAVDGATAAGIVGRFAAAGLPLTVAQTLRYNPVILALKKEFPRLDELYAFAASHRLEQMEHPWLDDPERAGGGVVLNAGVHLFDALHFITGREVRRVMARTGRRASRALEDQFVALFELDNGVVGTVDGGKVGAARCGRYEFVGRNGQLQGDQIHGGIELIEGATVTPLGHYPSASALVPLLRDWHAHLVGRAPNPIPGEAGLAAVRVAEACLRSAREERWITVSG